MISIIIGIALCAFGAFVLYFGWICVDYGEFFQLDNGNWFFADEEGGLVLTVIGSIGGIITGILWVSGIVHGIIPALLWISYALAKIGVCSPALLIQSELFIVWGLSLVLPANIFNELSNILFSDLGKIGHVIAVIIISIRIHVNAG